MRRIVATLLVVASPVLMVAPVGAADTRTAGPVPPAASAPALTPAPLPAPFRVAPPAAPVAAVRRAVAPPTRKALSAVRPSARAVRAKAGPPAAAVGDAAYEARLQADLCAARQIFCGLDRSGRYPAR